jgi:hypothetical protein
MYEPMETGMKAMKSGTKTGFSITKSPQEI